MFIIIVGLLCLFYDIRLGNHLYIMRDDEKVFSLYIYEWMDLEVLVAMDNKGA